MKVELNNEFREKHPQCSLSLSTIVNLRENLFELIQELNVELFTLAAGWTYFLKILHAVNKSNHKLFAAACVLLAYKHYEEQQSPDKLHTLLRRLAVLSNSLHPKALVKAELSVSQLLDFSLCLTESEYHDTFALMQAKLPKALV